MPALVLAAADDDAALLSPPATGEGDIAPLDTAYSFDAEGLVSLTDTALLPAPRGSLERSLV